MYCISDKQIDFILDDIRARGIEMVSLQQDLLDHICCVIEHNLDDDGDFEGFYQTSIKTFYKNELKEIEAETVNLLIHKNYYVMKKVMLISGVFSAAAMTLGILFKFMHWPGAAVLLLSGIVSLSLLFLPLLFVLKAKEKKESKDKVIIAVGAIAAILLSLGVLFKMFHWPFANIMCLSAILIMVFVFLPIYFISGIRNPDTKINTIVSSVIIIAGSGLILALVRSSSSSKQQYENITRSFMRNELILKAEEKLAQNQMKPANHEQGMDIFKLSEAIKSDLLKKETGQSDIGSDADNPQTLIGESLASALIEDDRQLKELKANIEAYNAKMTAPFQKIPLGNPIFTNNDQRVDMALNYLTQIQIIVLQNQRILVQ